MTKGERLRVLIAGGAHPMVARNLGKGSTQEQAHHNDARSARITIHHSATRPSFVCLPVLDDVRN